MNGFNRTLWAALLVIAALFGQAAQANAAGRSPGDPVLPNPSGPEAASKRIIVDISEQRVTAYRGSRAVMRFPVSTGRNGNTVTGTFRILDKRLAPKNPTWGYSMPNWMGIYWVGHLENGFHALPVTEDGRELWGDLIGSPASDGCVVLRSADMKRLYRWAEVGTPVEIVE